MQGLIQDICRGLGISLGGGGNKILQNRSKTLYFFYLLILNCQYFSQRLIEQWESICKIKSGRAKICGFFPEKKILYLSLLVKEALMNKKNI